MKGSSNTVALPATGSKLSSRDVSLTGTTPWTERVIEYGLLGCGLLTIATTLGILGTLALETVGFLSEVPLTALLFDTQWTPLFANKHFGIWPLVTGTLVTSTIALSV
ncbi:MAG TPA: hypothetical protein VN764_15250, partial [Polyangiaceae bacterium]|nr:hypothetical protein [Polyangiaceae bacterium]